MSEIVPVEFQQEVDMRVLQARIESYELLESERPVLECKWDGCHNEVASHRGPGTGYCTEIQENGKTHRQMHLEEKRAEDPGYGKRRRVGTMPPLLPSRIEKPNGFWLVKVRSEIEIALSEVEDAERNLEEAKQRLRETLARAAEVVK